MNNLFLSGCDSDVNKTGLETWTTAASKGKMSLRSVQWSQQIIYEIVFDINEPRERPQESESLIGCHLFGNLPGVNVMTTISPLIKDFHKGDEC